MLSIGAIVRAIAVAAIALLLLQQADKGMWWHLCQLRGIRRRADTEELYLTGVKARKFFVARKIIPAAVVCVGAAWMTAVDRALGGLLVFAIGIVAFMIVSTTDAFRTLWRLDGR